MVRQKCGKSTINAAVINALGDYAGTVGLESFTSSSMYETGGRAREDLAALVGKRLMVASEATEHQRLNPAVLKKMLGGTDKLSLRKNYGEQYEALPTFGLWILTNYPHWLQFRAVGLPGPTARNATLMMSLCARRNRGLGGGVQFAVVLTPDQAIHPKVFRETPQPWEYRERR